ncbi:MAG: hypothetical protein K9N46_14020 [Candidatus Marinimicrobia bacterium]|nr:hypothetical protein [Candidatus Neomarinimicrobiota bacterium]MCF7830001.1 hypothetical protein [Candidatus Neomarinimicrobiota bacterium]MCF7881845.1 hypothetical protein [Candidatus Neomarinimicrobiota bacterium]
MQFINIVAVSLAVLLSIGCAKTPVESLEDYFHRTETYRVPDSVFSGSPMSAVFDKSRNLYVSDFFKRKIIKIDSGFTDFHTIGRRGVGPYEYSTPMHIGIWEKYLYFSDQNNGLIKRIPLTKEIPFQAIKIPGLIGARHFGILDTMLLASSNDPGYFLRAYSLSEKREAQSRLLKKFPGKGRVFKVSRHNINGGSILADSMNSCFYVSPAAPGVIITISEHLEITDVLLLNHLPGFEHTSAVEDDSKLPQVNIVQNIALLHGKSEYFFLHAIRFSDPKKKYYYLIDKQGSLVRYFVSSDRIYLCSSGRYMYFWNFTESNKNAHYSYIEKYRFETGM